MKQIRVVIVDDKEMIRTIFRTFLGRHDDLLVVAEAENGAAAIEMVEQHKPDVVLMDSSMPGLNGYETTKTMTERFPETKVIMLSHVDTEEHRQKAREAGAVAFITKDLDPQEIVQDHSNSEIDQARQPIPILTGGTMPQKPRILLIDDNEVILDGLKSYLTHRFDVVIACDGLAAKKAFDPTAFDLIITDLIMPAVCGIGIDCISEGTVSPDPHHRHDGVGTTLR